MVHFVGEPMDKKRKVSVDALDQDLTTSAESVQSSEEEADSPEPMDYSKSEEGGLSDEDEQIKEVVLTEEDVVEKKVETSDDEGKKEVDFGNASEQNAVPEYFDVEKENDNADEKMSRKSLSQVDEKMDGEFAQSKRLTRSVSQKKLPTPVSPKRRITRSVSQQRLPSPKSDSPKRRMTRSVSQQKLPQEDKFKEPRRLTCTVSSQKLASGENVTENPMNQHHEPQKMSTHDVAEPKQQLQPKSKDEDEEINRGTQSRSQEPPITKITPPSVSDEDDISDDQKELGRLPGKKFTKAFSTANMKSNPKIAMSSLKAPSTSHLIAVAKLSSSKNNGGFRKVTPQSSAIENPGSSFASKFRSRHVGLSGSPSKKVNITTGITSFLPGRPLRNQKPTEEQLLAQKEEELRKKKEKEDEAIKRKEERDRLKREAVRKNNEARQQKVLRSRQAMEQMKQENRIQLEKEAKEKLEAVKKAQLMAEERRKKELEAEKQRKEDEERSIKLEEERRRRVEEEEAARKRLEDKRLREIQEKERKQRLEEDIRRQREKLEQLEKSKLQNLNSTFTKQGDKLNTTYNKNDNYEITPARHELPPETLVDPNNYDIADLKSDEDTDDEDNPRKKPAKWAVGKLNYICYFY